MIAKAILFLVSTLSGLAAANAEEIVLHLEDNVYQVEQIVTVPTPFVQQLTLPSGAICQYDVSTYSPDVKPVGLLLDLRQTSNFGSARTGYFTASGFLANEGPSMVQIMVGNYWCYVRN